MCLWITGTQQVRGGATKAGSAEGGCGGVRRGDSRASSSLGSLAGAQ